MAQSETVPLDAGLSGPVGHFMRPTLTCSVEDSIQRAGGEFRRNGGGALPVVDDGVYMGAVTESCLAAAIAGCADMGAPISSIAVDTPRIAPYASAAEALRLLSDANPPVLVVADDAGRVLGLISPSDLFPRRHVLQRPSPVGGMATPFGVYLTSGGLHGGASLWAVAATGAVMASMGAVAIVLASLAATPLTRWGVSNDVAVSLAQAGSFALFLAFMRLVPLSGTHGAEHMVVHAMERGEELRPEIVARMPRVHPRCGTNLVAAMTIFLFVFGTPWIDSTELRVLAAAFATMWFWRPLGSMAQQYITTKKPNERQLRSGIRAANELIESYSTAHFSNRSTWVRIWNTGVFQVMGGGVITMTAIKVLSVLIHVPLPGIE